jgi:hypothetical protein
MSIRRYRAARAAYFSYSNASSFVAQPEVCDVKYRKRDICKIAYVGIVKRHDSVGGGRLIAMRNETQRNMNFCFPGSILATVKVHGIRQMPTQYSSVVSYYIASVYGVLVG